MKNRDTRTVNNQGFTIVELVIATTVFSIILLMASGVLIQMGRMYYRGVVTSKTQEVARNISEDVARSLQFGVGGKEIGNETPPDKFQFCVGRVRYTWKVDGQVPASYGLRVKQLSTVDKCKGDENNALELLGDKMRVLHFDVRPISGGEMYSVSIRVAYGDNYTLTHYEDDGVTSSGIAAKNANCKSNNSDFGFCSVAQLDTVVRKRLK